MTKALSDPETKWSFSCLTDGGGSKPPDGGLVLQQMQHEGHNFAKDIRVVGFWVETETVSAGTASSPSKKFYLLDAATFTVSPIEIFAPAPPSSPVAVASTFAYLKQLDVALDFKEFFKSAGNYFAYTVKARFTAPAFFKAFPNCDMAGLNVEQVFLFSRYGNAPVHEPSGGLNAARCHPILRYEMIANAALDIKKTFTRVKSIRFDYRLHLCVDRHHDLTTNAGLKQIGNQAGLFADGESGAVTIGAKSLSFRGGLVIGGIPIPLPDPTKFSKGVFEGIEKPLVLEVTLSGLESGFSAFRTSPSAPEQRCWDNVHWWGARGAGKPLISAPGAFHAAHIHWRWGKAASDKKSPQFGAGWPSGVEGNAPTAGKWGPIVDPNIWMQTIRVAIVKNDPKLDPNKAPASSLSKADWKTLFDPGLRATPDDVSAGDDLVMWYSVGIPSEVTFDTSGAAKTFKAKTPASVFVSGIFFAHDAEITGVAVGTTDPQHFPTDEATIRAGKKWYRLAW